MGLKQYQAKRNFRSTREPAGKVKKTPIKEPFFVVQKHDATRLHYDFRLEMEGVLKSWAVPKGFPMMHGDRRLAVEVEDHPIDYARFEGTIPPGNYGAGTVMVWDIGSYQVADGDPVKALRNGKLHLTLKGKKLKGEWILVRMRWSDSGGKTNWLLMKGGKDLPPISARAEDQSVLTRRSMAQIAGDNDAQWQSNRQTTPAKTKAIKPRESGTTGDAPARRRRSQGPAPEIKEIEINVPRLPSRRPQFVEPMKAALTETLPRGAEWIYELKFDGVRALALKDRNGVRLMSRNAKEFTARFPEIIEALEQLPAKEAMLDGEIVALDEQGRSSFQLLQANQLPGSSRPAIFYYVFDLVQLDGKDFTGLPLLKRKAIAQELLSGLPDVVRFSSGIQADSERLLREMKARGLEGLIAKCKDSPYEIGRRSGVWRKFKWTNEQEFVIGGYTPPRGTRSHFGAILVGYYDRGQLRFASKVGTGFDQKLLKSLFDKFRKLTQPECPFVNLPEKPGAGGRGGLLRSEMKRCTWLQPKLVCQIRFAEWTRDHHLRQPAFLGLREDKRPEEVVREKPAAP
jgi:bifunctional non-homologous end joining protein LigD